MNSKVFSQLDTRWAKLPYPNKKYTLATSGCGCVSITHVIIEIAKYAKYTPKDVQPYMKQFAVAAQGTMWSGITYALKHYGFKPINHATMDDVFKTLAKRKKKLGIILFRKGTRGGITWTTCGHFVAFVDYKTAHGRHYFYVKDSGGRKHTGWYCYETQMKGLIPQIWTAEAPEEPKKKTETAKKKATTKKISANAKKIAETAKKLAYDSAPKKARYPSGKPTTAYKQALNRVFPNRKKWGAAPRVGASCDVYAATVIRESGVDKKFPRSLSLQYGYLEKSDKFDRVKNPTVKTIQDGDVIIYKNKDGSGHIMIYSDKKIRHASYRKWYGRSTKDVAKRLNAKGRKFLKVYRAK